MKEKPGKIDRESFIRILSQNTGAPRSTVIQGPRFGVDTALIKIGENRGLVMASDPTSLIPNLGLKESAWLSVILTANDIATSGYLPEYAQFVLNLPNNLPKSDLEEYWKHIHSYCSEMGISITGGHTGFGDIGKSTISGGVTLFAEVNLTRVKSTTAVRPNLDLIMTKSAAVSSAALLAMSFPKHTANKIGAAARKALSTSFYQISILPEVQAIQSNNSVYYGVLAMHDITEGGVLGAVFELCEAGAVGAIIKEDQIPLGSHQNQICNLFDINPYQALGAGSLLIACEKKVSDMLIHTLKNKGITASKIGETVKNQNERVMVKKDGTKKVIDNHADPYWDAFFNALTNNLK